MLYFVVEGNPLLEEWLGARADACIGDKKFFNRPCSKLRDGKCAIYADRPRVCRDKAVSVENCAFVIEYTGGSVEDVFGDE